ncbi:putative nuclease HARBI1 [Bombina bombina]|uniref:putative nuclease HARBI1 n=1 Tax=Bombina bombina TaxID=8345 RepID=UPI00235B0A02|nr:putative nuclease HARBI1 [Bombina bombina]
MTKLLGALHFLASGSFQVTGGIVTGVHKSTLSKHLSKVIDGLYDNCRKFIFFPTSPRGWRDVKRDFFLLGGIPNVLGAIDCTHIALRPPVRREIIFRNRKHFHSLNVQIICDANMRILNVVAGFPGSSHDAYILRNSGVWRLFETNQMPEGHLLADSAYPLKKWIWTPLKENQVVGPAELRYNEAHIRTRAIIERLFGVLKMRFRCLDRSGGDLQFSPEKAIKIIVACCCLHNMAQEHGMLNDLLPTPQPPGEIFEPDVINHPQPLNAHLEGSATIQEFFSD